MVNLPDNHPQRFILSNEVHARPPIPLDTPVQITCIAMKTDPGDADADRNKVIELTEQYGATPPGPDAKHYTVDLGDFRLTWERHTEFIRYTFIRTLEAQPFVDTAIEAVPEAWLSSLPGKLIAGANLAVVDRARNARSMADISNAYFSGNGLIGSDISDGAAMAVTDFRIHKDGFSRFLVLNGEMSERQCGQIAQHLLEIETYRIVALLGLPVAQGVLPQLATWESELSQITAEMTEEGGRDEPQLLDRLTSLQAAIEKSYTTSQFRFSASAAYYALVQRRIEELRETRMAETQTFFEFTERRLAPAMATCASAERRQAALSERVDRAAQLLSTRVDLSLEQQNAEVLASMNQRVELQLRLQQTVEGLSIAAITYYIVGVIGYIAKGMSALGWPVDAAIVMGLAAPAVLGLTAAGVWRARKEITRQQAEKHAAT